MTVNISPQVEDSIRRQAPQPRRLLRAALRALEREKGDIKGLEHGLAGYYRLRVRSYRILFAYRIPPRGGPAQIDCIYCERRSIVYDLFTRLASTIKS